MLTTIEWFVPEMLTLHARSVLSAVRVTFTVSSLDDVLRVQPHNKDGGFVLTFHHAFVVVAELPTASSHVAFIV